MSHDAVSVEVNDFDADSGEIAFALTMQAADKPVEHRLFPVRHVGYGQVRQTHVSISSIRPA